MTSKFIVEFSMFLIYYHIGGLSTTNILRLTSGISLPVYSSKCICDSCGEKIPAILQLPVISYLICRGKCRVCSGRIPVFPLFLELTVIIVMFSITLLMDFSFLGVLMSFLSYEIIRIIVVHIKKKRESDFKRQYLISVILMIPFFLCSLFVSLIHIAVAG